MPFKPKLDSKATEIKPFSFDERVKHMLQKKDEKLHKLAEEQYKVDVRFVHIGPIQFIPRMFAAVSALW